jgi:hypothetical protein
MPATKTKTSNNVELDRDWADFLIDGYDFFLLSPGEHTKRFMWERYRETIMKLWYKFKPFALNNWTYPCCAGNRPFGWWLYDAPEKERKHLGGYKLTCKMGVCLFFGLKQRFPINQEILRDPPRYETSLQYMTRLDLLTEYEKVCLDGGMKYIPLHDFKIPVEQLQKFFQ